MTLAVGDFAEIQDGHKAACYVEKAGGKMPVAAWARPPQEW